MAVLYSNTGSRDGLSSGNLYYITTSPPEGTTHAIITSITWMFYQANGLPYGPGTVQSAIYQSNHTWSAQSQEVITFDVAEKIVQFTFNNILADLDGSNRMYLSVGSPGGWPPPGWTIYKGTVSAIPYVIIEGTWAGPPVKATTPSPENAASDQRLNVTQLSWVDGGGADTYNVYFGPTAEMTLRSSGQSGTTFDLSSIILEYNTSYQWRIDSVNQYGTTTGDTWSFSTLAFDPVLPTGVTLDGDGNPTGTASGLNNMTTLRRLVAAANNKIWIEDV